MALISAYKLLTLYDTVFTRLALEAPVPGVFVGLFSDPDVPEDEGRCCEVATVAVTGRECCGAFIVAISNCGRRTSEVAYGIRSLRTTSLKLRAA